MTVFLTIEVLLAGKGVAYPRPLEVTFKKAPKARKAVRLVVSATAIFH